GFTRVLLAGIALLTLALAAGLLLAQRDYKRMLAYSSMEHMSLLALAAETSAAREIGCLGYVARASGLAYDARVAHPFTPYDTGLDVPVHDSGDVLARFLVRAEEIETSFALIEQFADGLSPGAKLAAQPSPGAGPGTGVGLVEGWRGTIATRVELAPDGTLTRVKPVDPSFFNWPALPVALADTIVPDFPLTNKSFNLSYAGNDL
ncbi:NADH-quinone oxidoreductase subunit D-related protein, partial [Streptomyces sp. NPDC001393]